MKQFWETTLLDPLATLGNQILELLPNVLGMIIIRSVGWASAWLVGLLVQRLLHVIGLDRACDRLGLNAALARGGVKSDLSQVVGRAAYWIVLVFAAIAALSALNLQPIKDFAHSFLAYIPHLLMAMLILVAGLDRKSTRLNSSHITISYAVFCLKKKKKRHHRVRPTCAL